MLQLHNSSSTAR